MRERGLKLNYYVTKKLLHQSLPMRERGLKLLMFQYLQIAPRRSPCGSVG